MKINNNKVIGSLIFYVHRGGEVVDFEDGRRDLHDGQHNVEHESKPTITSSEQANRFAEQQILIPFTLSEPQSAPPFPAHKEKVP